MAVNNSLAPQRNAGKPQTFSAFLTSDAIKNRINAMVGGMDAQQTMMEGMDDASGTGYISPDASLVFAYRDGNLTYKISETFTIGDKLFNKLKGQFKTLHDMWMQYFYRDVYENSPYLAPENGSNTQAEASDPADEEDDADAFADFMDTAEPAVADEDTEDEK